jgi:hypothetical protein
LVKSGKKKKLGSKKAAREASMPLQKISPNQEGSHVPWAMGEDQVRGSDVLRVFSESLTDDLALAFEER